jgi:hypothetical protein
MILVASIFNLPAHTFCLNWALGRIHDFNPDIKCSILQPMTWTSNLIVTFLVIIFSLFATGNAYSQESKPGIPVVCYYHQSEATPTHINFPLSQMRSEKSSDFVITYEDVPESAKEAIEYAIDIWETQLTSSIPIHVNVKWTELTGSTLAVTGAKTLYRNFSGAINPKIWYPVALAEKIAGESLNDENEADLEITINKTVRWYLKTDGAPPFYGMDLVSVILHETAHGLGITSASEEKNNVGLLKKTGGFLVYDMLLENSNLIRLTEFPDSSEVLLDEFTNNHLYFHSPSAALANNNNFPKVYAPSQFFAGTSISHLDENTFARGDSNSLMSPSFASGEVIHAPGKVLIGMLNDIGWDYDPSHPYELIVFPNPSAGIYNLTIPLNFNNINLKVIDAAGRTIYKLDNVNLKWTKNSIDLSFLARGTYTLVIKSTDAEIHKRLILSD